MDLICNLGNTYLVVAEQYFSFEDYGIVNPFARGFAGCFFNGFGEVLGRYAKFIGIILYVAVLFILAKNQVLEQHIQLLLTGLLVFDDHALMLVNGSYFVQKRTEQAAAYFGTIGVFFAL